MVFVLVFTLLLWRLYVHQSVLFRELKKHTMNISLQQQLWVFILETGRCSFRGIVGVLCWSSTGPVCNRKPVSRAPVRGLKEFPQTGGLSMRERSELPSWVPGQSIMPAAQHKTEHDIRQSTRGADGNWILMVPPPRSKTATPANIPHDSGAALKR